MLAKQTDSSDYMSLTEVKLKSGVLAIILAAVMIFSAFVVCADSNIAAADGSSGGGTATIAKHPRQQSLKRWIPFSERWTVF